MNRARMCPIALFVMMTALGAGCADQSPPPPRVFLLDSTKLAETRRHARDGASEIRPAIDALKRDAQQALAAGPFSVMDKPVAPPSGDKHDYMSQAPYFWKNPDTADGLPYVRRDGERNPEINQLRDRVELAKLISTVETLSLAYYYTGDETYAAKATELLRGWFLDPATRMNPNFEFAQAVPGVNTGRGTGLIETAGLTSVIDGVGLIAGSKAWTEQDQRGMEQWFDQFLTWMRDSRNGRDEAAAENNHGTYYDVQVATFALFVGKDDIAKSVLRAAGEKRVATQIEPDGRQPRELARTKSWGYSNMNLRGLMMLATLGQRVNVDLWNFQTSDGRSIRKAVDFLAPFALGEEKWKYQQLGEWPPQAFFPTLRRAAEAWPDGPYRAMLSRIPPLEPTDRAHLLHPDLVHREGPKD